MIQPAFEILNQRGTPMFFSDVYANIPTAGVVGRIFIRTDSPYGIYRDNGSSWDQIAGSGGGGGNTIYTGDDSLTGDRTISLAGYNLRFDGAASVARVRIDADTNVARIFSFATNDVARWALRVDGTESGSNAGSDFAIRRYSDAGAFVDSPFSIIRSTGQTFVGTQTTASGKLVINTSSSDAHLQVIGANSPSFRLDNAGTGATQRFAIGLATATNNFIQGSAAGNICITTASANPLLFGMWQTTNASEVMRISTGSNLLIGSTTDSGEKLQVTGNAKITGATTINAATSGSGGVSLIVTDTNSTVGTTAKFSFQTTDFIINTGLAGTNISNQSRSYIGFLAGSNRLTLGGSNSNSGMTGVNAIGNSDLGNGLGFAIVDVGGQIGQGSGLNFYSQQVSRTTGSIRQSYGAGFSNVDMLFLVSTSSTISESYRIFGSTKNIGINTTSDAGYKLDVSGTTRLNGLLTLSSLRMSGWEGTAATSFAATGSGSNALQTTFQCSFSFGPSAGTLANSTFIGYAAGGGATNATNSNFLGNTAGNAATNASFSNLFGFQVGRTFTGNNIGSNNIIIGTNISLPNSTANALNLGGVIFAVNTYSTTTGDPSVAAQSTGRVSIGAVTPATTAILDLTSTTLGFLPPRMTTTQKNAITTPAAGLVVYDTTLAKLCVYTTAWETITSV